MAPCGQWPAISHATEGPWSPHRGQHGVHRTRATHPQHKATAALITEWQSLETLGSRHGQDMKPTYFSFPPPPRRRGGTLTTIRVVTTHMQRTRWEVGRQNSRTGRLRREEARRHGEASLLCAPLAPLWRCGGRGRGTDSKLLRELLPGWSLHVMGRRALLLVMRRRGLLMVPSKFLSCLFVVFPFVFTWRVRDRSINCSRLHPVLT